MDTPKVVAYLRTGRESTDGQERAVAHACEHMGYDLVGIYRDQGIGSGTHVSDRPGFAELMRHPWGVNELPRILMVMDLSRLSHDQTIIDEAYEVAKGWHAVVMSLHGEIIHFDTQWERVRWEALSIYWDWNDQHNGQGELF